MSLIASGESHRRPRESPALSHQSRRTSNYEGGSYCQFQIERINPTFFTGSFDEDAKRYLNYQNKSSL